MPLEVNDVFAVLGLNPEEITDATVLKNKVEALWFQRKAVPPAVKGEIVASLSKAVQRDVKWLAKNADIAIEDSEIEGKELEDIVKLAWTKREDKYKADLETLQGQIGKPDEALAKLTKEKEKLEAKLSAAATEATKLANEFDSFKTTTEQTRKGERLQSSIEKYHTKVKFIEKLPEVSKEGYFSTLEKKYKRDLDDDGNLIVMDQSGNKIPGKAANSFKTYEDILEEEGLRLGTWPINNLARNQAPIIPKKEVVETPETPSRFQRVIAKPIS